MKGAIVFQNGTYLETVLDEMDGVRLVDCSDDGVNKLYRIEYEGGHEVAYNYDEAFEVYEGIVDAWNSW